MPLNQRLDKENVVYLQNEVFLSGKNNEFLKFVCIWMELELLLFRNPILLTTKENLYQIHITNLIKRIL